MKSIPKASFLFRYWLNHQIVLWTDLFNLHFKKSINLIRSVREIKTINFKQNPSVDYPLIIPLKTANTIDLYDLKVDLNTNEETFIQLACSIKSYQEISEEMNLDKNDLFLLRTSIFNKFNVSSRIGIIQYAVEYNLLKTLKF